VVVEEISMADSTCSTSGATIRRPLIGVGVVVVRPEDGKIYVGVRKGSHGATKLALPGGHLEFGEAWAVCAAREGSYFFDRYQNN
jgi:ADP-ribose pyrophosphatase YjhB (NUDIX family)